MTNRLYHVYSILLSLLILSVSCDVVIPGLHQEGDEHIDFDSVYDDVIRLEMDFEVVNYGLFFVPDIEAGGFYCEENITINILTATKFVELHGVDLEVVEMEFSDQSGNIIPIVRRTLDEENHIHRFYLGSIAQPGEYLFKLQINGRIIDGFDGFYRSHYLQNGEKKYIAVTQMEPTGARKMFFCADDPMYKSTFDISVEISRDQTAISNGKETYSLKDENTQLVSFERTPKMSTYLVSLVIGYFDVIETSAQDGKTLVRVFTTPGQKERAHFAADFAPKVLDFFSEYFEFEYPMNKLDLISIPDFAAGAMENWGCMTFRETALLIDTEKSSLKAKMRVAEVIAHEIAHQWFGNLVTMNWWTDLWLKEGFATWASHLSISHVYPEWQIWEDFVSKYIFSALELDSLSSSHPIQVKVTKVSDLHEIYDRISYDKGASIIHMLSDYLGYSEFRKSLSKYLNDFQYQSTKTKDLWDTIEAVTGKDISGMMYHWTNTIGFPVVNVEPIGRNLPNLIVRQKPFFFKPSLEYADGEELLSTEKYHQLKELDPKNIKIMLEVRQYIVTKQKDYLPVDLNDDFDAFYKKSTELQTLLKAFISDTGYPQQTTEVSEHIWKIPFSLAVYEPETGRAKFSKTELLDRKAITVPLKSLTNLYSANPNRTGYYRVRLSNPALVKGLYSSMPLLPALTRLGMENDVFALYYAGQIKAETLILTLSAFEGEKNRVIVEDLVSNMNEYCTILSNVNHNVTNLWNEFIRGIFQQQGETLGWDPLDSDTEFTNTLRAVMYKRLALSGWDLYYEEGHSRFQKLFTGELKVNPDMKYTLYSIGMAFGGEKEFNDIIQEYRTTDLAEERVRCLASLGESRSPEIIQQSLEFVLSDEVRPQDFATIFSTLGTHKVGREIAWNFIKENVDTVIQKLNGETWLLGRLFKYVTANFASTEKITELEELVKKNKFTGLERTLQQVSEKIQLNYSFISRALPDLENYFSFMIREHERLMENSVIYKTPEELEKLVNEFANEK
eukprot:TRINITY_DN3342_c0_g1_i1.p1 TRINITY_DN3342_c0_g1~~TRINITY_DN3342_c0_g1_i1.p1  ORF type:complete len:1015 (-),score=239.63 TRINITY_DN3342_c0_g1_i1:12-3056(-)